MLTKDNHQKLN